MGESRIHHTPSIREPYQPYLVPLWSADTPRFDSAARCAFKRTHNASALGKTCGITLSRDCRYGKIAARASVRDVCNCNANEISVWGRFGMASISSYLESLRDYLPQEVRSLSTEKQIEWLSELLSHRHRHQR